MHLITRVYGICISGLLCLPFLLYMAICMHGLPFLLYMDICKPAWSPVAPMVMTSFKVSSVPRIFYVLCLPIYGQCLAFSTCLVSHGFLYVSLVSYVSSFNLLCLFGHLYGYSQLGIVYFGLLWLPDLLWSCVQLYLYGLLCLV